MIEQLNLQLGAMEKELRAFHRGNATSQRLASAPGIGLITATALATSHRTRPLSKAGGISRPGWGSRRAKVPLAESPACSAYRRRATAICAACS
jgi:transposase